jgi:hypothetical protein
LRAETEVNAVTASSYPPADYAISAGVSPGASLSLEGEACHGPECSEKPQRISATGETLFGPAEVTPSGREAYKGKTRKRSNNAEQRVGGGRSTGEPWENRGEGRTATSIIRQTLGGSRTAPAREGFTPAQSSQAQSAREIRSCPQTAKGCSVRSRHCCRRWLRHTLQLPS